VKGEKAGVPRTWWGILKQQKRRWEEIEMEALGIIGFVFGLSGLTNASYAWTRIARLEAELKRTGVLDEQYKSGRGKQDKQQ